MKRKILNKNEAKKLIDEVFDKILNSNSSLDLYLFRKETEADINISFNEDKYPKIEFTLTQNDIEQIKNNTKIDDSADPLTKLLYAMAWKQGDLPKLKHIISGIENVESSNDYEGAQVFYQFGKHIANPDSEPIVDQHVLRAFSSYYYEKERISKPKKDKQIIIDYKDWLRKQNHDIENKREFLYEIDKLLFVTGKAIKNV